MKKTRFFMALIVAAALAGCAKDIYVDSYGGEHEMSAASVRANTVRDIENAKIKGIVKAAEGASEEGKSVLAAVIALMPGRTIERERTWDERALPWASLLMPWFLRGGDFGWQSGASAATVSGDGNVVNVVGRMSGSNFNPNQSASNPLTYTPVETYTPTTSTPDTETVSE